MKTPLFWGEDSRMLTQNASFFVFLTLAYLLGSLSPAVAISRLLKLPDPRLEGSKNPGATNVLRLGGKRAAVWVLVCDALKGALPVLIAGLFIHSTTARAAIGIAAVLGHVFPVFYQFKGGKGVATALGVLLALHWVLGLAVVAVWISVAAITRYSSLSAMIAAGCAPIFYWFWMRGAFFPVLAIAVLVLLRHRPNMVRLMNGMETKIKS